MDKYTKLISLLEQQDLSYNRWATGSISSVAGPLKNAEYGQTDHKGPIDKSYAKPRGIPVSSYLRQMYNSLTTRCYSNCQDTLCKTKCRYLAASQIVSKANNDLNSTSIIRNKHERDRVQEKIATQLNNYQRIANNALISIQRFNTNG